MRVYWNKLISELRSRDYRHYICIGISLVFLGLGFLFPNAIPRLAEAVRDLAISLIYYVLELFSPGSEIISPTVNNMPTWEWAESPWAPLTLFPYTWEEFKVLWSQFMSNLVSKENFFGYLIQLGDIAFYTSRYGMVAFFAGILLYLKLKSYTMPVAKPKKEGKSKPLEKIEQFLFKIIYPVIAWIKDFVFFVRDNKRYYSLWFVLWMLYFNIFSLFISFFAFYFYFAISWNFISIYTQLVKLMIDLAPMVRFIPALIWAVIGIWVYNYICRSMAFVRLYSHERANRAFLKKRGVVTTVYGEMGTGKTQLITALSLSAEVEQWDNAFEIMLENDLRFPNFPWHKLRDYLKREVSARHLLDLDAVKDRLSAYRNGFNYVLEKGFTPATWAEYRKSKSKKQRPPDYTFGYDFEHYAYTYNIESRIIHLYQCIEEYACAYLIYTVRTSLIFANYSIRVDSIIRDVGNMPSRDNDFFARDPRLKEAYSRQCHIINYDMLRLGKRMQKAFKLSFGVYVITEIDKERKNAIELQETKRSSEECNQNNDLFNACLMMCRHAAVVANRVFIRIICDLQRPEAWGAAGRELGEVIYIYKKGEEAPVLPILSPYWLCEGLFSWLKSKWNDFEAAYDVERRDATLFDYVFSNLVSKINHHYEKVNGLFGSFPLHLEIQSGRLDGKCEKEIVWISEKKDRSDRYKTNCLSSVFNAYEPVRMHIDDFVCYSKEMGTLRENSLQNSYFQNDIIKMHNKAA